MKKIFKTLLILTIIFVIVMSFTSCNKSKIKYDKDYVEYFFNGSNNEFVKTGRSLVFNNDDTFNMKFDYNVELQGTTELFKDEQTIFMDCDTDSINVVLDTLKKLGEKYQNDQNLKHLATLVKSLSKTTDKITEEMHYHKNYVFSSTSITGHKHVNTGEIDTKELGSIEGIYDIKGSQEYQKMLLQYGNMYVKDSKTKKYNKKVGTYVVSKDFITMDFESEGKSISQVYLIADFIMPTKIIKDLSVSEVADGKIDQDKWYSDIDGDLERIKGIKIKVLVLQFYSTKEIK